MSDTWHPTAQRNPAPRDRWLTLTGGPNRTVLHTTETDNFTPGSTYYGHQGWPHFTLDVKKLVLWQHIPVNYGAPTLLHPPGTPETNRLGAVQIEIVWRAYNITNLPPAAEGLLAEWIRWVEAERGVKHHAATFVGPEASPAGLNRPQRFTWAQWVAFDGVCGHQHVPGNDHWDPGKIDIKALLATDNPEGFLMALTDQEQAELRDRVYNLHEWLDPQKGFQKPRDDSLRDLRAWVLRILAKVGA